MRNRTREFLRNTPLTIEQIAQYAPAALQESAHESRTSKYTQVSTLEIIKGMSKAGFQVFSAMQSRVRDLTRDGFQKHILRFRHEDSVTELSVGGRVFEIVLKNAHDGSSRYELMAGIFRLVCGNGMIVADSLQESISIKHMGDIVAQVVNGSNLILEASSKVTRVLDRWSNLQLTDGERYAFAVSAHQLRFADANGLITTPIRADQLLVPRRTADVGRDLWSTLNVIQEHVIKGGDHGVTNHNNVLRNVSSRAVTGIDGDVKLNRALWTLAETLEQYKGSETPLAMVATAGSDRKE